MEFLGYKRPDGSVGIRNHVVVMPGVVCADVAARKIAAATGATYLVPTGIAMAIPEGFVGLIYARSGLSVKQGLAPANKVGVIDADYRGEILVALYNQSAETRTVAPGDRIAQMVIAPYLTAEFSEAEELSDTERGAGGFGSTGKN